MPPPPPCQVTLTTTILNRAPWNRWSGANRMFGLGIRMNLGVVLTDNDIVRLAFEDIWRFLVVQEGACDTSCASHRVGLSRAVCVWRMLCAGVVLCCARVGVCRALVQCGGRGGSGTCTRMALSPACVACDSVCVCARAGFMQGAPTASRPTAASPPTAPCSKRAPTAPSS